MIGRVGRLVRAETIKLSAQTFFYVALVLIAGGVIGAEEAWARSRRSTDWAGLHALQLFSRGWGIGLPLSTFALVIFSSMLIAGEYDRGTIKVILTRPVTRTEVYLAKILTVLLLAVFFFAFVVLLALGWGLARGYTGPLWDETAYLVQREAAELNGHAVRALGVSALSFLAAGFLGLLVSTWTESSGFAVAIALILYFFGWLFTTVSGGLIGYDFQEKLFFHYGSYAVNTFQELAAGGTTRWSPKVVDRSLHVTVPLAYIAAFLPVAYGLFRIKNIHA